MYPFIYKYWKVDIADGIVSKGNYLFPDHSLICIFYSVSCQNESNKIHLKYEFITIERWSFDIEVPLAILSNIKIGIEYLSIQILAYKAKSVIATCVQFVERALIKLLIGNLSNVCSAYAQREKIYFLNNSFYVNGDNLHQDSLLYYKV